MDSSIVSILTAATGTGKTSSLAIALALALAGPAQAEFLNGNKVWELCQRRTRDDQIHLLGFVSGLSDANDVHHTQWKATGAKDIVNSCVPLNVTNTQLLDLMCNALRAC